MDAQTFADEIDRKALEQIERIMGNLKTGCVSWGEARFALTVLFDAVSGLCSKDVFDLISSASAELSADEQRTTMTRIFMNTKGALALFEYGCGDSFLLVKRRAAGSEQPDWDKVTRVTCEGKEIPFEIAKQRMEQYSAAMLRDGYWRIF